jgi:hypothetical protein
VAITSQTANTVVSIQDERDIYAGAAIVAPSPHNVFGQQGSNDPVSYTLTFATPLSSLSFTRPAAINGAIMPQWSAHALNVANFDMGSVGESSGYYTSAQTYTLGAFASPITSLRIDSNNGHFAAFNAVLIDDLHLVAAVPVPSAAKLGTVALLLIVGANVYRKRKMNDQELQRD